MQVDTALALYERPANRFVAPLSVARDEYAPRRLAKEHENVLLRFSGMDVDLPAEKLRKLKTFTRTKTSI